MSRPRTDNAAHGVTGRASRDARRPTPASLLRGNHPENLAAHHLRAFALQKHAKPSHFNTLRRPHAGNWGMVFPVPLRRVGAGG